MTSIHIVRDKDGFIWQIIVEGHANAARKGKDIVCAAVSTVTFTAINALEELVGLRCYKMQGDRIEISIPLDIEDCIKPKVRVILDTIAVGYKQIEFTPKYKRYISVLDEEV
jgi:uncharacterized protein YsxB (DUF464 family)